MKIWLAAPLLLLAGCQNYPRDTESTLDRIRAEKTIRVGLIEGKIDAPKVTDYLEKVSALARAHPRIETGGAEPLLLRLRQGDLDLVIGELAKKTPWSTDVMVIDPIAERPLGSERVALSPVARNGENRWIMLLEKAAREP